MDKKIETSKADNVEEESIIVCKMEKQDDVIKLYKTLEDIFG